MRPAYSDQLQLRRTAAELVAARLAARALADFPGTLPIDLDAAYACQDQAISLWPDRIVGWKVGLIGAEWRTRYDEERLVGPIFARDLHPFPGDGSVAQVAIFDGGFAAIEAEYVFRIGRDTPPDKFAYGTPEAAEFAAGLHVAVEIASSPLASVNALGPAVTIADFGNNAGLLLGPAIADWTPDVNANYTCLTEIEGRVVGRGGASMLPGGPLAALAFALGRCARRGHPLRAGHHVTTGASTGVHEIRPGQHGRVVFDGVAEIRCLAVARSPLPATTAGAG